MDASLTVAGTRLYVQPTSCESCRHLKLDMTTTPASEDIHEITNFISDLFRRTPGVQYLFHLRHVRTSELENLDLPRCLAIVGRIMQERELAEKSVLATVLQCHYIDGAAEVATKLFLSLYNPHNFTIACTEKEADAFLSKHEQRALNRGRPKEA